MHGRVAGTLAGIVALFIAVPAHAQSVVPPDPIEQPGQQESPPAGTDSDGGGGIGAAPAGAPTGRPQLTLFNVSPSGVSPTVSGTIVRFQVRDRARRVRVRLAFISLVDAKTYRVNLGGRRTGRLQTYSWGRNVPAGSYRVRITARNPRGKKAVRSTTMQVATPAPLNAGVHRFPLAGAFSWGGSTSRFGAARNGHRHQGQDLAAAEGTPLVAVVTGTISWRAYQSGGAGHYLVIDSDAEDYNYVYMHLQSGSLLVGKGDRVAVGDHIANVGQHRQRRGFPPALRDLGRPVVRGRPPGRSVPLPEVLGIKPRRYHAVRGEVAQSVEHTTENRGVASSILALAISEAERYSTTPVLYFCDPSYGLTGSHYREPRVPAGQGVPALQRAARRTVRRTGVS